MANLVFMCVALFAMACISTATAKDYGIHVITHVFSGRPNPEWYISTSSPHYKQLTQKLRNLVSTSRPSKLGYSGFTCYYMKDGAFQTVSIGKCSNPSLELELLDTTVAIRSPNAASLQSVFEHIRNDIGKCQAPQ